MCCCSFCSKEDEDGDEDDENGGGEGEGDFVNCVSSLPQPIFTFFCLVDLSCLLFDTGEEGSLVAAAAAAWTLLLQPKSSFSSLCSLLRVVGVVDAVSSSSLVKIVEAVVLVVEITVSTSVSLC